MRLLSEDLKSRTFGWYFIQETQIASVMEKPEAI